MRCVLHSLLRIFFSRCNCNEFSIMHSDREQTIQKTLVRFLHSTAFDSFDFEFASHTTPEVLSVYPDIKTFSIKLKLNATKIQLSEHKKCVCVCLCLCASAFVYLWTFFHSSVNSFFLLFFMCHNRSIDRSISKYCIKRQPIAIALFG